MNSGSPAEKARGKNARIVDDDQLVAAKQVGKLAKGPVFPRAGGAIEQQHARSVALIERALRDRFGGRSKSKSLTFIGGALTLAAASGGLRTCSANGRPRR